MSFLHIHVAIYSGYCDVLYIWTQNSKNQNIKIREGTILKEWWNYTSFLMWLTIQNLGFYHHISQQDTPSYCPIKSFDIPRKSDSSQNRSTLQELKMELMSLNGNISIFISDLNPE